MLSAWTYFATNDWEPPMSVNPFPPGSGRDHEWNGNDGQGHWPNSAGQGSNSGQGPQSESGWNQQPDTGWGQKNPQVDTGWNQQPSTGWEGPPPVAPAPQAPGPDPSGAQTPGRQYPQPKHPQSDSPQAQHSQFHNPRTQNQQAQFAQPQHPQSQNPQAQYAHPQYAQGPYAGAPTSKPRSRKGFIALFAVLAVVVSLGIGWGAATLFGGKSGEENSVAAPASSDAKSPSDAATDPGSSQSPEPTEADALPDDPAKALDQLVETDRPKVKADLDGKWVPQLSSKKLGLEAEGKTWKEKDILAEYQEMKEEFPRVQLVWSGDFKSFKENNFWVTIVGIGYDDPEQALSWCSSHGLGADACYAKQLNTSGGTEGTTRLQD